jgi:hypothetical protein
MMKYYKQANDEYIIAVGTNIGGEEITKTEYSELLSVIKNKPMQAGYGYRLKTDLTWERYKLLAVEEEELTGEEALGILLGGAV